MCIVMDKKGNQLLEVIQGCEDELIHNEAYRPLTSSLVIVKSAKGFMLLKNKYRNEWELAGGMIEAGETPRACAIRECMEESGYALSNVRFVGMLKFHLVPGYFSNESRIEFTTLYCADAPQIVSFEENDEMADLCWHNMGETIENASEIDVELLSYYKA